MHSTRENGPQGLSFTVLLIIFFLLVPGVVEGQDIAGILEDIRAAELDTSASRPIEGVRLETGFANLHLRDGFLFPTRTPHGAVVEMVFIGQGTLRLEPSDEIEAAQLELFTGVETLEENFSEAVLLIASDAAAGALLGKAQSPAPAEILTQAEARYATWREGPLRDLLDIEIASALDRLEDPLFRGHFGGFFMGEQFGELLISVQPEAFEQLTLGRFEAIELEGRERRRAEREISRLHRKGRFLGLELDDLGAFDTWVSMPLRDSATGESSPGFSAFEPSHYRLSVNLDTNDETLDATARITLEPQIKGARSVGFDLPADLLIDSVRSADGRDLIYSRQKSQVRVFLESTGEEAFDIEIEYHGKGLVGKGKAWLPIDNFAWYPRTGTLDRATYELEVTWPERYDLLASGQVVAEEKRGRQRWQKRKMERPCLGVTFSLGKFRIRQIQAGHVDITLAVDNSLSRGSRQDEKEIGDALTSAMLFFERIFGPYPDDTLTVVTLPTGLSQSLPGYIQLSNLAMEDDWLYSLLLGLEDRRTVIAHELAHQWWGNQIGWKSYRDQWISEAMANYSALLWARRGAPEDVVIGFGPTFGWQAALGTRLSDGRPIESIGPLVLGERLNSSLASGYDDIVYKKGAVVVDMLAGFWGEEKFINILGHLTRAAAGHVISTEDFFALIEKITDHDLQAFARRFVYRTGLPEVYYDYRFEDLGDGRHRIYLEAEQEIPYRFFYRIVETPRGLDVARERIDQIAEQSAPMVVPFQIEIDAPGAKKGELHTLAGRIAMGEPKTELQMEIEHVPKTLELDAKAQVFGRFFNRRAKPKRIDYLRAFAVAAAGEDEKAGELFRQVLKTETPPPPDAKRSEIKDLKTRDKFTDWRTRLQLVRLDIKAGDIESAERHLSYADQIVPRGSSAQGAQKRFRAHLDLLQGEKKKAYRQLKRIVRKQGRRASVETWLLLAIAAYETGHEKEAEEALAKIEGTGSDPSLLAAKLAGP